MATTPGVQNPHCTPPASTIARWTSLSTASRGSADRAGAGSPTPSIVVTS